MSDPVVDINKRIKLIAFHLESIRKLIENVMVPVNDIAGDYSQDIGESLKKQVWTINAIGFPLSGLRATVKHFKNATITSSSGKTPEDYIAEIPARTEPVVEQFIKTLETWRLKCPERSRDELAGNYMLSMRHLFDLLVISVTCGQVRS